MSGPVTAADEAVEGAAPDAPASAVEVSDSRQTDVGGLPVRRALPRRERRTVGPWCFVDHIGPTVDPHALMVGPHPHIGLQTVTWLLAGESLHRDSLGSEQTIRPGQLNLMTAGAGVAHAEEQIGRGGLHGVQLWVAQPSTTRNGPPAFEHHADLPRVALGDVVATVLVGVFASAESPARRDTDHVGVELELRPGTATLPVRADHEHALVVLEGAVGVEGAGTVGPGRLVYLGVGRDELPIGTTAPGRALLVGGVPFPEPVLMWWNYVARDRAEITAAHRDWLGERSRFGSVASRLGRVVVGPPPWPDA